MVKVLENEKNEEIKHYYGLIEQELKTLNDESDFDEKFKMN